MNQRIEDYALVGDTHTAALVGLDGSIDWLCLPRFDSGACFAALLGESGNGRWLLAAEGIERAARRRYRDDTLILETDVGDRRWHRPPHRLPADPRRDAACRQNRRGRDAAAFRCAWSSSSASTTARPCPGFAGSTACSRPSRAPMEWRFAPVPTTGQGLSTTAHFTIGAGERVPFVLSWYPSHLSPPAAPDPATALADTDAFWREWSGRCAQVGPWRDAVVRSLITLKALTYAPTGGIVAAPTTSLPEALGGVRNWDYRYCWVRDATFTLYALMHGGYREEAASWRDWLLRAVAGDPSQLQILYGIAGERQIPEQEIGWLGGYEDS